MQSNRAVGFVLLIVLAVGAIVAWQLLGSGELPTLPDATNTKVGATRSADAGGASVAVGEADETGVREAVEPTGPGDSDLPSIVGQVVGPDGQPLADAEVLCTPGGGFMPDFENFDPTDTNIFDPQANLERMRRQVRDRVSVLSDVDGRFRIRVEGESRKVSLRVLARRHLVLDRSVQRPTDRDTDVGRLTLKAGAVIAGRVLDATGNTVAGARVSRMLAIEERMPAGLDFAFPGVETMDNLRSGESCVTDENGRFELAHVEAGNFSLRARHAEYPTTTRSGLSVAQGQSVADILLTMARGAQIRGTVAGIPAGATGLRVMTAVVQEASTDPTGGIMSMLGGASDLLGEMGMSFSERQADIASDGAFVLRGLKANRTYRLWVGQQGRGFAGSGVCSARVEAKAGSVGIELRYDAGITVTFVVKDAASGEPIERLWVRDRLRGGGGFGDIMAMAPSNTREKPYPEGKVTVANLRPKEEQTLRLTIDAVGYAQLQSDRIALPASGNLDLGTLRLEPRPVLQVTVLTESDDKPIAFARVQLRKKQEDNRGNPFARMAQGSRGSNPRTGRTDAAGKCTLNVFDADEAELEVTSRGYAPMVADEPVAARSAGLRVVRMVVGGSVEVTVLGPDKKPISNANVEHRTEAGNVDRRRTDKGGLAQFLHLTPGSHAFRIPKDRGAMGIAMQFSRRGGGNAEAGVAWESIDVVNREVATLSLEKSPTARLRGIVRENGVPLVGATVAFREGQKADGPNAIAEGIMNSMLGQMGGRSGRQTKTGDDGVYDLSELPSGEHNLRITHRDRAMPSSVAVLLHDGDNRFDVELDMTTLRGVVRDSHGNPVDGARVSVSQEREGGDAEEEQARRMMAGMMPGMGLGGPTQKTDASGAYELRGVAADVPLTVQATAKGLQPAVVEAVVGRGQTKTQVDLRMGEAGSIEVTVAKPGLFGAVQAKFVGPDADSVEPVMQMLRRGKGTLKGLRPGTWEVSYRGMNRNDAGNKRTVEVLAGQAVTVDF